MDRLAGLGCVLVGPPGRRSGGFRPVSSTAENSGTDVLMRTPGSGHVSHQEPRSTPGAAGAHERFWARPGEAVPVGRFPERSHTVDAPGVPAGVRGKPA